MEENVALLDLPNEILWQIIRYLPIKSTICLKLSCLRLSGFITMIELIKRLSTGHRDQIFIRGCMNGKTHLIKMMLQENLVNLVRNGDHSLQVAIGNGHLEMVKILLRLEEINPTVNWNYPLLIAWKYGHNDIFELLLSRPEVKKGLFHKNCIVKLWDSGRSRQKFFELLMSKTKSWHESWWKYLLRLAILNNEPKIARTILCNPYLDQSTLNDSLLLAIEVGHVDIVKLILPKPVCPRKFGMDETTAELAADHGHLETFNFLLDYSNENSSIPDNQFNINEKYLFQGTKKNHFKIVKFILQEYNPKLIANLEKIFFLAVSKGRPKIVERLLRDKRIINYSLLLKAIRRKNKKMVKILLGDPHIDPTIGGTNEAYCLAASLGYNNIANLLLSDPRVNRCYLQQLEYFA